MKPKLQLASMFTLLLLSSMLFAILMSAAYVAGTVSGLLMIIITILFNILAWLFGPFFSDWMYKIFYKIEFYEYEQVKDFPYVKYMKRVCDKHKIPVPKIGIIKDHNPTAFTYGSHTKNARVVLTEGLFEYLNETEMEAVIAHELGHIVNRDFIIMAIASTLLQMLYQFYVIFARRRSGAITKKGEKKEGNYLVFIGYAALLFHWLGTYLLLYLSRTREYFADQFAAEESHPNALTNALLKIAYGIMASPDQKSHLLVSTRAQGIFDHTRAKEISLAYRNQKKDQRLLERALLFDLVSPWAKLMELGSTHPLVGKRVASLAKMSVDPVFDLEDLARFQLDMKKIKAIFYKDVFFHFMPTVVVLFTILVSIISTLWNRSLLPSIYGMCFVLIIAASILKVRYRFPTKGFIETNVIGVMGDIYASPARGIPVIMKGKSIGRGQAGYIFGEDMMFEDSTGLVYLNYESGIPFFGNLIFGWKKVEKLLRKPATIEGWFFRGASHHIELRKFESDITIKSYVRFWYIVGVLLTATFYIFLVSLVLGFFYFA